MDESRREIVEQSKAILELIEAGKSVLEAEGELVKIQNLQCFRQSHLVKLLNDQKKALDDDK